MAKWMLVAGAAAIALTAPALAGQDKGKGGGGGQKAERGGEKGGGGGQKAERGGGNGGGKQAERGNGGGQKAERQMVRSERGNGGGQKAERQAARSDRGNDQAGKAERKDFARRDGGDAKREARVVRNVERREVRNGDDRRDNRFAEDRRDDGRDYAGGYGNIRGLSGLYGNCPPGLAKKGNGCLPPGQAKKMIGAALPAALGSQMLDGPFRQWYRDDERHYYREDGDYIYRVNRQGGLIDALFPSLDRDYSYYPVGMNYPSEFDSYNVPYQYQSYFADNNDYNYRYGDGAIYQVNRSDNMINSIVALLAGDLGVGQQMPSDYGVYNVPMAYRDRYYDTPEASYRYNDGYIYQADPKTQLITAVIDALV